MIALFQQNMYLLNLIILLINPNGRKTYSIGNSITKELPTPTLLLT